MTATIQQSLNAFSLAFLGLALGLFVFLFGPPGTTCTFGPSERVPWSSSSVLLAEADDDLLLRVTRENHFYIGPNVVRRDQLDQAMRDVAGSTSTDRAVHISADAASQYASVEAALRAASHAGFRNVVLITFKGNRLEMRQHDPSRPVL